MDGWTILEEEVDAVYLSWNEIQQIFMVDLSNHTHLVDYRNDFVVGCLTGLRFSDFSRLSETDIRGDLLYKKQEKSDRWVVIPLRQDVKEILVNRFRKKTPVQTYGEFNRLIKTIAKLAGIVETVKHSYKKGNQQNQETTLKFQFTLFHSL
jgi:hypothetical protein